MNPQTIKSLNMTDVVKPYRPEESKKAQVADMFDNIAHSYDFLNHFFSLGIDILWRKKAIRALRKTNPAHIVDIASGTGDFAIEAIRMKAVSGTVTGVDISEGMLEVGRKKMRKRGIEDRVKMVVGDSENLQFPDNNFDGLTVGFGVRNFENLEKGLSEMLRVIKPGALACILEFSKPSKFPMKQLFGFYFRFIMPLVGKIVSKDSRAYTYLPESVQAFPEGPEFVKIMEKCGYTEVVAKPLTGGIATIYFGKKKNA
jgi:demethylmenaquinone methyltransferase / 2-methoxy-6-polyprenyl-1,4-benzoquinol methylase